MLDAEKKVQHINDAASNIIKNCKMLHCVQGKLYISEGEYQSRINEIINKAFVGHMPTQAALLTLNDDRHVQLVCLALGNTRPVENVMLLFLDPKPEKAINADLLSAMYGINAKEAAVVEALMQGLTLRQYSEESDIPYDTVKSRLNSVFVKTKTKNQQSMIALLSPLLKTLS